MNYLNIRGELLKFLIIFNYYYAVIWCFFNDYYDLMWCFFNDYYAVMWCFFNYYYGVIRFFFSILIFYIFISFPWPIYFDMLDYLYTRISLPIDLNVYWLLGRVLSNFGLFTLVFYNNYIDLADESNCLRLLPSFLYVVYLPSNESPNNLSERHTLNLSLFF